MFKTIEFISFFHILYRLPNIRIRRPTPTQSFGTFHGSIHLTILDEFGNPFLVAQEVFFLIELGDVLLQCLDGIVGSTQMSVGVFVMKQEPIFDGRHTAT